MVYRFTAHSETALVASGIMLMILSIIYNIYYYWLDPENTNSYVEVRDARLTVYTSILRGRTPLFGFDPGRK